MLRRLWKLLSLRWKTAGVATQVESLQIRLVVATHRCEALQSYLHERESYVKRMQEIADRTIEDAKRIQRQTEETINLVKAELSVAQLQIETLTAAYKAQLARYHAEIAIQTRTKMAAGMVPSQE